MEIINDAVEDGTFYAPTLDLRPLDDEAERRIMAMRAEATEANRIIAGIVGSEPISAISSGAPLLIPRSMLDSIEIILPSVN